MIVQVEEFDCYYSKNYNGFVRLVKTLQNQIRKEAHQTLQFDSKDIVNDCYLKIRDKFPESGWTGINITGYTMISLKNQVITCKTNGTKFSSINLNHHVENEAEHSMNEMVRDNFETQLYKDQTRELSRRIFHYIETNFTDKECFVFRHYYLNKKQTYRKVQKATGLSMGFISESIKKMKQSIKENQHVWNRAT